MKYFMEHLDILLMAAATGQIMVAFLNVRLDKILRWESELAGLSLLLREVFHVHKWFITITLLIFGAITLRFAGDIGGARYEMARWFAAGAGFFWAIRTVMQWLYYSPIHWRGNGPRTLVHWILTLCYGGCAAVYLLAAFQ